MKTPKSKFLEMLACAPLLAGCLGGDDSGGGQPASSFEAIQTVILDAKCTECHRQGEEFAVESGLVLTADAAYQGLVGAACKNEAARAAGMQRVTPGRPEKSLLYLKLMLAQDEDSSALGYGHAMPFGKPPLSNGHIEYIRQWILAGAPQQGFVGQADLLKDKLPGKAAEFTPLVPPAAGEGYQVKLDRFTIPPQFEREFFLYQGVGNPEEIFVNRFQIKMRAGSHHFLLYMYDPKAPAAAIPQKDVFRELRNLDGTLNLFNMNAFGDKAFVVAGSQLQETEFSLPAGVAVRFPANASLDFNSHYVNYGEAVAFGEVNANLYTVPAADVQHEARALNMANSAFKLPPGKVSVITTPYPVGNYMRGEGATGSTMSIVSMFSHTHQLAQKYVVMVRGGIHDGDTLYVNDNWHHPPYRLFTTPVVLAASDTVTSVVTYSNTTSEEVGFGFRSVDEMNIIFGYWY